MPIYAYKCAACGFQKDIIQKFSDAPLTQCPACEAETFSKQLTAPSFQLKGSGWYVTDFRDGGQKKSAASGSDGEGASGDSKSAEYGATDAASQNDSGAGHGSSSAGEAAAGNAKLASSSESGSASSSASGPAAKSSNASTSPTATT